MPHTAAVIDVLREAFGADGINASIRRGMKGEAGAFWSRENGHEVGTRDAREGVVPVLPMQIEVRRGR